jgi:hypothetical protein
MHRYRQQPGVLRYRCRNYPACRTYVKVEVKIKETEDPPAPPTS